MLARLQTVFGAFLAVSATVIACGLSVVAGLQRGATTAERGLIVAVGVVLVVAAHLIPALVRSQPVAVRVAAALLWIGCMAGTMYGHATFFVTAARDAGVTRAATVVTPVAVARDAVAVARERADTIAALARARAMRCSGPVTCGKCTAAMDTAQARIDALDVEREQITADTAAKVRADEARTNALRDPLGVPPVAMGVGFAVILECVACLLWFVTFKRSESSECPPTHQAKPLHKGPKEFATGGYVPGAPVNAPPPPSPREVVVTSAAPVTQQVTRMVAETVARSTSDATSDVQRVRDALRAQQIERGTVKEIRKFLSCSQRRAMSVRDQIDQPE